MLSEELIKKAAPLAHGFEIHENLSGGHFLEYRSNDEKRYVLGSDCDLELYELFLQRVIEGYNLFVCKKHGGTRHIAEVEYYPWDKCYYWKVKSTSDGIKYTTRDQAKEQAIIYILDNN